MKMQDNLVVKVTLFKNGQTTKAFSLKMIIIVYCNGTIGVFESLFKSGYTCLVFPFCVYSSGLQIVYFVMLLSKNFVLPSKKKCKQSLSTFLPTEE